jgi:hypothetical protein
MQVYGPRNARNRTKTHETRRVFANRLTNVYVLNSTALCWRTRENGLNMCAPACAMAKGD